MKQKLEKYIWDEKENLLAMENKAQKLNERLKFKTSAENDKKQIFYYNYNKKDRMFTRFLAIRKQTSTGEIIFFN